MTTAHMQMHWLVSPSEMLHFVFQPAAFFSLIARVTVRRNKAVSTEKGGAGF